MRAEILNIGTELLVGQIVNSNAAWMARSLAELGVDLHHVSVVGDNLPRIVEALQQAWSRVDLVLITGGLGPTSDDLTHEALACFLGVELVTDEQVLADLRTRMERHGRGLLHGEDRMASFPGGSRILPNPTGTASGVHASWQGRDAFTFPGVPHEMMAMWQTHLVPWIQARTGGVIRSRVLRFVGIAEAELAGLVQDLLDGANPSVAPYAGGGEVVLRVTAKAADAPTAEALVDPVVTEILARAGTWCYGEGEASLPAVVGRLLRARHETLATAESCTAGLIASRITDIAGSSDYFLGGAVVYSVAEKVRQLGLEQTFIERYGHVSPEVSRAIAERIRERTGATWALGVTGFAGGAPHAPDPANGTVHVALSGPPGTEVLTHRFGSLPREQVKLFTSHRALAMLWRAIRSD